jgi:hypothetical protein
MQRYLIVVTKGQLPAIPERFERRHVKLSGGNACVVADDSATTEELSRLFGFTAEEQNALLGVVVKLEYFSGTDVGEVVDKLRYLSDL